MLTRFRFVYGVRRGSSDALSSAERVERETPSFLNVRLFHPVKINVNPSTSVYFILLV